MFIIRWPVGLMLLVLALLSFLGAAATAGALTGFSTGIPQIDAAQEAATNAGAAQANWIEVGLWAGAGIFFLISMVRLLRRTQAFWTWLLGFALYGGRWAYAQQSQGGLQETAQSLTVSSFQPDALAAAPQAPAMQVTLLAAILIVGLLVFLIDAADRAYWDKQGA